MSPLCPVGGSGLTTARRSIWKQPWCQRSSAAGVLPPKPGTGGKGALTPALAFILTHRAPHHSRSSAPIGSGRLVFRKRFPSSCGLRSRSESTTQSKRKRETALGSQASPGSKGQGDFLCHFLGNLLSSSLTPLRT